MNLSKKDNVNFDHNNNNLLIQRTVEDFFEICHKCLIIFNLNNYSYPVFYPWKNMKLEDQSWQLCWVAQKWNKDSIIFSNNPPKIIPHHPICWLNRTFLWWRWVSFFLRLKTPESYLDNVTRLVEVTNKRNEPVSALHSLSLLDFRQFVFN